MPDKTLQVVSVTAADNNLDLTVGDRRAIRTNCASDGDLPNIAHGATTRSQIAAPVGERAAIHP
jgi:hypothetical protein